MSAAPAAARRACWCGARRRAQRRCRVTRRRRGSPSCSLCQCWPGLLTRRGGAPRGGGAPALTDAISSRRRPGVLTRRARARAVELLQAPMADKLPSDLDSLHATFRRLQDSLDQAHAYVDDVVVRARGAPRRGRTTLARDGARGARQRGSPGWPAVAQLSVAGGRTSLAQEGSPHQSGVAPRAPRAAASRRNRPHTTACICSVPCCRPGVPSRCHRRAVGPGISKTGVRGAEWEAASGCGRGAAAGGCCGGRAAHGARRVRGHAHRRSPGARLPSPTLPGRMILRGRRLCAPP